MTASSPVRALGRRGEPHPRPQRLADRRLAPQLARERREPQAGVGGEDDVGIRVAAQRRQGAGRVRRHHVAHLLARGRLAPATLAAEAPQGVAAPLRGEVAALREQHQHPARPEAGGDVADLRFAVLRVRGVEHRVRHPVADEIDAGVDRQRLLEHDARGAVEVAEQLVDEQHRVAGAGMAAEEEERPVALQRRGRLRRRVLGDVDVAAGSAPASPCRGRTSAAAAGAAAASACECIWPVTPNTSHSPPQATSTASSRAM